MKIRVKYSKTGPMKFIGHLDTMRYFQKLNRRAGIDVAYSEGYSPHQKMSFAQPLSVGVESLSEYFDLEIKGAVSSEDLIERYNRCQAEGIWVEDIVLLPEQAKNAMASIAAADYEVRFREGFSGPFDLKDAVREFLEAKQWLETKETKKGSRQIDLKELTLTLRAEEDDSLFMTLSAASGSNLKPVQLIESIFQKKGFSLDPMMLCVTRKEIYTETEEGKRLLPLIAMGSHFPQDDAISDQ